MGFQLVYQLFKLTLHETKRTLDICLGREGRGKEEVRCLIPTPLFTEKPGGHKKKHDKFKEWGDGRAQTAEVQNISPDKIEIYSKLEKIRINMEFH